MPTRVLVVDDDPVQVAVLVGLLEHHDYYVETAENGFEAVRKARSGWFEIVLMDYRMPEIDGLAAARLIADLTAKAGRPTLIGLSASPERLEDGNAGVTGPFAAVVRKPCDSAALLATMRRCFDAAPKHDSRHLVDRTSDRAPMTSAQPTSQMQDRRLNRATPLSILVVDDDTLLLDLVRAALESSGYCVDTAVNGLDAVRKLEDIRYDILITDYRMPEIDGLAAAKLVFELHARSDRPCLIAFTATPERVTDNKARSPRLFDEVVAKSDGLPALLAATKRGAERRQQRSVGSPMQIPMIDALTRSVRHGFPTATV